MAEQRSKRNPEKAPRKLVIVESPGKIKALSRYLGPGYRVMASLGHVRDLPKSRLAIDVDGGFAPEYIIPKGKNKLVKDLRSAVSDAEAVYLAPDPDREGEAIAWHLQELLKSGDTPFFRIAYQEITPSAVREALEHPGEINLRKVDAQTARRVMDRLMGYKISPLLWKKVASGLSAGRVQSVALLLVCRREEEIREFRPEEYWLLDARFSKPDTGESFWARLEKVDGRKARLEDGESASGLEDEVRRAVHKVARVEEKERAKAPPLPFITSSLQLEAARRFRWTVSRTMKVAQGLYEGVELGQAGVVGLITYMRTDSYRISADALRHAREYIAEAFGPEYLPAKPKVYRARQGAQDAHEAIRPTDFSITPEQARQWLPPDQARLYALIWRRTVAGQMAPARLATVTVAVESGRCEFVARRERVVFPGYLKVWEPDGENAQGEEPGSRDPLPFLKPGEELALAEMKKEQKFTQPPARYSEGTLVKALEANGVGRRWKDAPPRWPPG
ncbi:MAG TPA: type I DNA topoisomerase, partial [bacterium]|nr:type I DNA topoisomerase [bacterium]